MKPTKLQYDTLERAFEYFNKELFENKLPRVFFTFSRRAYTSGFFFPKVWRNMEEGELHEISLNPQALHRKPIEVFSTLVHEQVHLWQHLFGRPSEFNYHNKEWGRKMESIGLIPSKTGKKGGEKIGKPMSHYIQRGGRYEEVFNKMDKSFLLPFLSTERMRAHPSKVRHYCEVCDYVAWTNILCHLICGQCGVQMTRTQKKYKKGALNLNNM